MKGDTIISKRKARRVAKGKKKEKKDKRKRNSHTYIHTKRERDREKGDISESKGEISERE